MISSFQIGTYTKPQQITNKLLESLSIDFINEKIFKYYSVDNYLTKYNLIIEVMGDFWHSNPIMFDIENLYQVQSNRIIKDKNKMNYIFNHYGIHILYLWQHDLYENPNLCKELILKYVNQNGILDNYNSFNYCFNEDTNIELKEKIILPYFEK